jgi:DNA-binding NarL/FixJ family response regulator
MLCREGVKAVLGTLAWVEVVGEAGDDVSLFELIESTEADAVLLDPGISRGPQLHAIERVLELAPEVRVIIMATLAEHKQIRAAIELGAQAYVLKTVTSNELATALRLVADGRNYVQGELVTALVDPPATSSDRPGDRLAQHHLRILQLVAQGLKNKQLAAELDMSETTVKSHLRVIFSHLDVSSRVEAVTAAFRHGILE